MAFNFMFGALLLVSQAGAPAVSPTPAAVSANHLALHVADAEASAKFYTEVFGLARMPRTYATTIWLKADDFELHLIGGRTTPVRTPREVHFALRVPDLASVMDRLDERGVPWGDFAGTQRGVQLREDSVTQIFLQDPDGYWIEVNQLPD